uniref:Uncharacterized protein n=1 Tax=Panthera leo TaxID=9689 RepID=A0A8C8X5C8_PANLE
MGPRGAAAVAVGLWVLVTAGEAADPGVTTPRRCLLSHYRSLDPRAVAAVKALRDRYVSDAQTSPPVPEGPLRPSAQQARLGSQGRIQTAASCGAPLRSAHALPPCQAPKGAPSRPTRFHVGAPGFARRPRGAFDPPCRPSESYGVQCTIRTTVPGRERPTCRNPRLPSAWGAQRGGSASPRPLSHRRRRP